MIQKNEKQDRTIQDWSAIITIAARCLRQKVTICYYLLLLISNNLPTHLTPPTLQNFRSIHCCNELIHKLAVGVRVFVCQQVSTYYTEKQRDKNNVHNTHQPHLNQPWTFPKTRYYTKILILHEHFPASQSDDCCKLEREITSHPYISSLAVWKRYRQNQSGRPGT